MLPLENLLLVTDATGIDRIGQNIIDVAAINYIATFDFSRWCGSAFGSQAQTPRFVCNLKDRLVAIIQSVDCANRYGFRFVYGQGSAIGIIAKRYTASHPQALAF